MCQCFHERNDYKELGDAIRHVTFQDTHLNKERSYINFLIYNTDAVKLESSIQPSPAINMFEKTTKPSTEAFRNSKITSMWQSPKTCFLKYSVVIFGDE